MTNNQTRTTKTRHRLTLDPVAASWAIPLFLFIAFFGDVIVTRSNGALLSAWVPQGSVLQTFLTVFLALVVQAIPFLLLGILLSGVISAFVPVTVLTRLFPRHKALTIPTAAAAGLLLPTCECASVPVAKSLMTKGLHPASALVFVLAAPSINPVVLVATAVAFPAHPMMVWARLMAGFAAAVIVGFIWLAIGTNPDIKNTGTHSHCRASGHQRINWASRIAVFRVTVMEDFLLAGGFLIPGACAAAAVKLFLPDGIVAAVTGHPVAAVALMVFLAVVMSLCSEADAFIAASLTSVSPVAQLAFLVVGPMVDMKLIAVQLGMYGSRFTVRFIPVVLGTAIVTAVVVGMLLF